MKRTLLAAALLFGSTTVASAGVYGGLSVGPDGAVQDDAFDLSSGGRAVRLLGGYRLGPLSAEASVMGNTFIDPDGRDVDHRQIALLGKYNFPLGSNFELFGRGGLQRTWLSRGEGLESYDVSGTGILLGPGIDYVIKLVAATVTIRLDYTLSYAKPSNENTFPQGVSVTSGQWMLGFTVGM